MKRLPRIRLRTLMILVAVPAIGLGAGIALYRLHLKSLHLSAIALTYGREANRLESRSENARPDEVQPLLDRSHWNDAVADAYRHAASRPWTFGEPDPAKIVCQCGYHAKLTPARPGP